MTPDRAVIGPHTYSIEFVEALPKKRLIGVADRQNNTVKVVADQAESQVRSTLLHELLHQAFWSSIVRHMDGWSDDLEEAAVTALEGPLLELFARPENKALRDWLKS